MRPGSSLSQFHPAVSDITTDRIFICPETEMPRATLSWARWTASTRQYSACHCLVIPFEQVTQSSDPQQFDWPPGCTEIKPGYSTSQVFFIRIIWRICLCHAALVVVAPCTLVHSAVISSFSLHHTVRTDCLPHPVWNGWCHATHC